MEIKEDLIGIGFIKTPSRYLIGCFTTSETMWKPMPLEKHSSSILKILCQYYGITPSEKAIAFRLIEKSGVNLSLLNIPTNQAQLAYKLLNN